VAPNKLKSTVSVKEKTPEAETARFPIVGIGASAGGLEALEQFLGNVPDDSGMGYVVVQHLDPTHKGMLPELLQRITKMKVFQVKDRMAVKPDCVYVIPPNSSMSVLNGVLHLFKPMESRGLRLPIDFFFTLSCRGPKGTKRRSHSFGDGLRWKHRTPCHQGTKRNSYGSGACHGKIRQHAP
jgi:two-component system CheB/CheR fusion protein